MNALALPHNVEQRTVLIAGLLAATLVVLIASPWMVLALAVALAMVWLAWMNPAAGVGIVAATIPVQEALLIPIGPLEVTATQLTVLPLAAGWFALWLAGRVTVPLTPVLVAWALVTGAMALSVVNAVDRGAWAKEVYRWAIALALLAIACHSIQRIQHARPVLMGVAIGIVGTSGVAVMQVIEDDGPASFSTGRLMRAYGHFGEPNPLAAYLAMSVLLIAPLALVMLKTGKTNPVVRFGLLAVLVIGAGTLMLTQSRGGLLGFVAGAAAIAFFYAPWSRHVLLIGVLLVLPVLVFTSPGQSATGRLTSGVATFGNQEQTTAANWSVHERIAHWRAGLSMVEAEPLIGVGAGNFDQRFREHTSVWRFRIPRGHAHNGPVQVAAQSGLVGLVSYLALFFVAGARIARGVANARCAPERALALGAMGVLIAVAVHGQFDYLHGLSLNLAFVIALAMTEPALNRLRNDNQQTGSTV